MEQFNFQYLPVMPQSENGFFPLYPKEATLIELMELSSNYRYEDPVDSVDRCCHAEAGSKIDLLESFDIEYEDELQEGMLGEPGSFWTEEERGFWLAYLQTPNGKALTDPDTKSCRSLWHRLVLRDAPVWDFHNDLHEIAIWGDVRRYPYVQDTQGLPRVLLLGDSISCGVWTQMRESYGLRHRANIHTSANNGQDLEFVEERLSDWLGSCPWDLVQLNIGHHYHPQDYVSDADPTGLNTFREGLERIVSRIQEHSPSAVVVFALTTPSPFDTVETTPEVENCRYYWNFFQAGVATSLNDVMREVASAHGVVINDRYNAVLPHLQYFQQYCDIHFYGQGYRFMAKNDWDLLSSLLGLD